MKRKTKFPRASLETAIGRVSLRMEGEYGPNCIALQAEDVPIVYQGHRYFTIRLYLERRRGRWSLDESNLTIWRWADEEMKNIEEPREDERRALLDTIVLPALQYIDEHFEDFDPKRLERALFEDNREQAILGLRERIKALTEAASAAKQEASGPYSPCRGPAFASLRKTLLAQSKELRTLAKRTKTIARDVATIRYLSA
jgi:hypothetical protein